MASEELKEVMGFKLGQVLGRGAFGFVKEASLNENTYAMKVLIKGSSGWNANEEETVNKEIEIMTKLDHPHIIKIVSHSMNASYPREGGAEDCAIIVMELARVNLFDILYFTDGFSEEITRTYLTQLVDAIGYMHGQGIAHRDIKPQNTLLDENFNLKICGFGLSKETDGHSLMHTNAGTLPFQAPEMLMSRPYDFGVDVFALGVMFFLMLTGGIPPFLSAATTDKCFKYIAGKCPERFWKKHKKAAKRIKKTCGGEEEMRLAVELFFSMCAYQPTERATITDCAAHEWFNQQSSLEHRVNCLEETVSRVKREVDHLTLLKRGMNWFHDLDQVDKDNAVELLTQGIQHHNGLNQDILMDMETKFGITPVQTQQLYKFLYSEKMEGEELKDVMKEIVNEAMARKREDPELGSEIDRAVR